MKHLLVLVLILSSSCIRVLNIDFPEEPPKQVVNCLFTEGKPFKVQITHSIPILDNNFSNINNTQVTLYENEVAIETLTYENGSYHATKLAQPNTTYKIRSVAPNYEDVEASNELPNPPNITEVTLIEEAYIHPEYDNNIGQFSFKLNDNENQRNYYELELIRTYKEYNYETDDEEIRTSSTGFIDSSQPFIDNEVAIQNWPASLVFSDNFFNGANLALTMDFWNSNYEETIKFKVIIRSISEDYYKYKRRLNRHTYFKEGYIGDIFIEPIEMYTNIENGFGIFAGYQEYSQIFYHQNKNK